MTYFTFYIVSEILFFLVIFIGIPLIVHYDKKQDFYDRIIDLPNCSQEDKHSFAQLLGTLILGSFLPILREVVGLLLISTAGVSALTFAILKALNHLSK